MCAAFGTVHVLYLAARACTLSRMEQPVTPAQYSIGQILTHAWKHFRQHLQSIIIITLIVYIPVNIILSYVPFDTFVEQYGQLRALKIYTKIIDLLEAVIGVIATMAIAYIITAHMEGKTLRVGEALQKALARWPAAMGTGFLAGVFIIGLSLLLIVPGIIYSVYWVFVTYVVALRGLSWKRALDYSKSIVQGRWWTVVGYQFILAFLGIMLGIVVGALSGLLPEHRVIDVATDTFFDLAASYLMVASIIFFLNFDATRLPPKVKKKGAAPVVQPA